MTVAERLIIATRRSPLALWQAEHVRSELAQRLPGLPIELLGLSTRGDEVLDRALAKVGGKGLFIKELEVAMLEGRAHLAVHSLKDVPMQLAPEFALAAILPREDPRDCLVSNRYRRLADLPPGARVGTSSMRRELVLRAAYPGLHIEPVRGNLGTRLRKLDSGEYDALVLAAAGMKRLGFEARISALLPTDEFLPAPGQGALAIEILAERVAPGAIIAARGTDSSSGNTAARLVAALDDPDTRAATTAERAVSRGLGGSCEVALAAYAEIVPGSGAPRLQLRAWAGDAARALRVEAAGSGAPEDAEQIGAEVVARLRAQGVERLLGR